MKKFNTFTVIIVIMLLASQNIYSQKKAKFELYDVKVPNILKLGGNELDIKLVIKNTGNGVTHEDTWEQFNIKVYINGSLASINNLPDNLPNNIEPGYTFESEISVRVNDRFDGKRLKIEITSGKLGTMTKNVDLER